MEGDNSLKEMRKAIDALTVIARQLYEASEDFPAVNRNSKRLLASVEMLKINVEEV
ncbi:MAG: hypothetical protein HY912_08705 [Desulfomonile tiedjei]|uniref:Uncharacterized protein n=1 Tax=Desulfomonile tiedjei TaxID=2358 RepID=A0A9D6V001_9BACT|nr:hypothetical protein [Desulfomonile tiedjei]